MSFCTGLGTLRCHQTLNFGLISGLIKNGSDPILVESAATADVLNEFFNFRPFAVGQSFFGGSGGHRLAKANPEKAASPEIPEIRIDRLSISAS